LRTKSATTVRHLSDPRNLRDETTETQLINQLPLPENPEEAANFLLTLCHQATYLLNNQVASLKKKHEREGGLTEELYRKRNEYRSRFHE
jgi:four helix bundle suffix protein